MKQEINFSEARLVAGGGLYDHLPGPMFPPAQDPSQTSEEKRAILERLAGPQELVPNGVNGHQ